MTTSSSTTPPSSSTTTTTTTTTTSSSSDDPHQIALYYCYFDPGRPLSLSGTLSGTLSGGDPSSSLLTSHVTYQRTVCQELNLNGRIRVSSEGLNGVLSGRRSALREYERHVGVELRRLLLELSETNKSNGQSNHDDDDDDDDERSIDEIGDELDLDVKYCNLRPDIPPSQQLFDSLSVKLTREVVSLYEPTDSGGGGGSGRNKARWRTRRRRRDRKGRHRQQRERQERKHEEEKKEGTTTTAAADLDVAPSLSEESAAEDHREDHQQGQQQQRQEEGVEEASSTAACATSGSGGAVVPTSPDELDLEKYPPAPHLTPEQWNERLLSFARKSKRKEGRDSQDGDDDDGKDGQDNGTTASSSIIEDTIGEGGAVLLDARNMYEHRVGHFSVPSIPTILPNTRKYSSLPSAINAAAPMLAGKDVYMYCTGGVRCERASAYLRALGESDGWRERGLEAPRGIYQLGGGIQRYLEEFGTLSGLQGGANVGEDGDDGREDGGESCPGTAAAAEEAAEEEEEDDDEEVKGWKQSSRCLYRGKNFVFDPRRTDPMVGTGIAIDGAFNNNSGGSSTEADNAAVVGRCLLCSAPHDDYDNGHAPCENKEARCCRCRVLVLVCDHCRGRVRSWGEEEDEQEQQEEEEEDKKEEGEEKKMMRTKPDLFFGPGGMECVDEGNRVSARIVRG